MRTCTVLALCIFQLDATGFVYDPKKLRRIKLKPRRSVIIDGLKSPWFQTRLGKEIGSLFVVDASRLRAHFALLRNCIQPISSLRLLRFENKHTTTNNTSLPFILPMYEYPDDSRTNGSSQQITIEMVVCMLILFIVGGGCVLITYAYIFAYKFDNRNFKVD